MKKIILITFFIAAIVNIWSCEKFLDIQPQTGQTTDADFFKTKGDFDAVIFGAYAEMAGNITNNGIANWINVAGFASQELVGTDQLQKPLTAYMSPSNGDIHQFWNTFYKIASKANLVLDKLPNAPINDTSKPVIEGEAKFLRGFAYFNIARAFGSAPLLLKVYETSQNNVSCSTETEIWDQVIKDLKEASQKLPKRSGWGSNNLGRATKGSALAYLVNAYMYKKDWTSAKQAAIDLISIGDYNLLPNVRNVFSEQTRNSNESIFEVQYRDVSDGAYVWSGFPNAGNILPTWTAPRNIGGDYAPAGGWGETIATKKLADSYEASDDRRIQLIRLPGEKYKGEKLTDSLLIPLSIAQNNSSFSTKYWLGPQINTGQTYLNNQNVYAMRYAEFLLNYAEILFELGNTAEAYQQLNLVRQRAKLAPKPATADKAVFLTDLMNERRWELNFEPNLWFHYLRTGRAAAFLQSVYGITMEARWNKFPIPQPDRDQNPNLCQNTGY